MLNPEDDEMDRRMITKAFSPFDTEGKGRMRVDDLPDFLGSIEYFFEEDDLPTLQVHFTSLQIKFTENSQRIHHICVLFFFNFVDLVVG